MKDITLTLSGRRLRRESLHVAACVLFANALNAYAIVSRKTPWSELVTCLPFVLGIAFVLYAAWTVLRLVGFALRRLFGKPRSE